jgi:Spy/CpxP family protein refolding chaperone
MKIGSIALSLLAAGLVVAQSPAPHPRMGPAGGGPGGRNFEQRLATDLGLSAEQQNKVHTTLAESNLAVQGSHQKMQDLHTALSAAIKSGNEGEIDRISQEMATLHQQQTAARAKSVAKIYSILTADQKAKVGENLQMLMGGPGLGGPNPRMRQRPGSPQ